MQAQHPFETSIASRWGWPPAMLVLASVGLAACATPGGPRRGEPAPPPPPAEAPRPSGAAAAVPSLESLAGSEWVLRQWDAEEPAPAEPAVTLRLEEGHFVGRSGCNQYSAPVRAGTSPGTLTVGNPIATKMLCRPPQMEVEFRFLQQLSQVHAFGCAGSSLTLTYQKDGVTGVMRFERRQADEGSQGGTPPEKIPG